MESSNMATTVTVSCFIRGPKNQFTTAINAPLLSVENRKKSLLLFDQQISSYMMRQTLKSKLTFMGVRV